jgi:dTDP-4-amino-4,6-dideoxygalactose transaminase
MTRQIPIARPWLGEAEAEAARAVVLSGWVMQGPKVAEFERRFAEFVGASHACAVSSGTAALILALKAIGVGHGDVVLTVSHSFIATANVIRACGAEPVFVDIEPAGYNIDPETLDRTLADQCRRDGDVLFYKDAERLLSLQETPLHSAKGPIGRVAAILAVHQVGFPCDVAAIERLSQQYRIPWIEDAACAIGSQRNGRIGQPHSIAACFSFHPRKLITTGDGGMITTNSAAVDAACRQWRQHGLTPPAPGSKAETYASTGYNYRLTDIQAAIGIEQLARLPEQIERRRAQVGKYREGLAGNRIFRIWPEPRGSISNWQSLPVDFGGSAMTAERAIAALAADGISAKPGIMNAHSEPPYSGVWTLPESEKRFRDTVLLPLYHDLDDRDIARVTKILDQVAAHG